MTYNTVLFTFYTLCMWVTLTVAQNVHSVIQMRDGGQWTSNEINYHIYDIITTNNGDTAANNISIVMANSEHMFHHWNLLYSNKNVNNNNNHTTFNVGNNIIILPGKSVYVAGFLTSNESVPSIISSSAKSGANPVESETSCSKIGLYFELQPVNASLINKNLRTLYYISFHNYGTSIITHSSISITTSKWSVIDEDTFFGLDMTDDIKGYNVSFSTHLFPGESVPESAGFELVGPGGAYLSCESASVVKGTTVDRDSSKLVAAILIGGVVAVFLIIAVIVLITMYTRKMRKKRNTYNLRVIAGRYQQLATF